MVGLIVLNLVEYPVERVVVNFVDVGAEVDVVVGVVANVVVIGVVVRVVFVKVDVGVVVEIFVVELFPDVVVLVFSTFISVKESNFFVHVYVVSISSDMSLHFA